MQTILYTLVTLATVLGLLAGFLVSLHNDHKIPAIWVLFAALILYAFTLCLYLDNAHRATKQLPEPSTHEAIKTAPTPTPTPSPTPTTTPTPATKPAIKTSQSNHAEYEPDETAIQILIQIDKDIAYESEIARTLQLEPAQVRNHLRLLEQNGYIRLHQPDNRGPYYQLTQKAIDHLKRPNRIVPFPSGGLSEPLEKTLVLFTRPHIDPFPSTVATHLSIHIQRAILYLSDLEADGYIRPVHSFAGFSGYRLTDKARRYLADRNLI